MDTTTRPMIQRVLLLFGILLSAAIVVADPEDQLLRITPINTPQAAHLSAPGDLDGSPRAWCTGAPPRPRLQAAPPTPRAAWKNPPLRSDYPG